MNVQQRRRLTDLYSRGHSIKIEDTESGGYEEVYLRKMTPTELDEAFARATSARSRFIITTKSGTDETLLPLKKEVEEMSHEDLVNWVVSSELTPKRPMLEAQVADTEEWSKDKYLAGLQEFVASDEYTEKLQQLDEGRAEFEVSEEIKRVQSELARFAEAVEVLVRDEEQGLQTKWDGAPDETLREKVLDEIYSMKGNSEWLIEYKKTQIWLCTYESESHKTRYFSSREEIDQLQAPVVEKLLEEIEKLHVVDAEGKDSQQNLSS